MASLTMGDDEARVSATWPRQGGCRCGALRFEVAAPPMFTMACHCTGCQRMTGGPFSLGAAFKPSDFKVMSGEPVEGGLRGGIGHRFCDGCKSWVFTLAGGFAVNVRTPMLDEHSDLAPFIETYTSEKLVWANTPAEHSFERFPEMADYGRIVQAYAARG